MNEFEIFLVLKRISWLGVNYSSVFNEFTSDASKVQDFIVSHFLFIPELMFVIFFYYFFFVSLNWKMMGGSWSLFWGLVLVAIIILNCA